MKQSLVLELVATLIVAAVTEDAQVVAMGRNIMEMQVQRRFWLPTTTLQVPTVNKTLGICKIDQVPTEPSDDSFLSIMTYYTAV